MGKISEAGATTWVGIAHGQVLCNDNSFTGIPPANRWAVIDVVDFGVWNGTMRASSTTAPDAHGHPVTGGVELRNMYCNGQRSDGVPPSVASYVSLEARFGTAAGANTPQSRVSFLVYAPHFGNIRASFSRRGTTAFYSSPVVFQSAASGWVLYSYFDPCNKVDQVIVTAEVVQDQDLIMYVTDFAWGRDSTYDRHVIGSTLLWQSQNGIMTVAVPNFCLTATLTQVVARMLGWHLMAQDRPSREAWRPPAGKHG